LPTCVWSSGGNLTQTFRYRPEVLGALAAHGVLPRPHTRPQLVRDYLNDLYRHELRLLRDRVLRRQLARADLSAQVIELRRRYTLLSLPLGQWTE
jgi:hypothetical protein